MFGTVASKIQKDPKLMIENAKNKMAKMDVLENHNQLPHLVSDLKGNKYIVKLRLIDQNRQFNCIIFCLNSF